MASRYLAVFLAVAACVALSSSALVFPDADNALENNDKDKNGKVFISDLTDDGSGAVVQDGGSVKIDDIDINSLSVGELSDFLDDEDNLVVADLDIIAGKKELEERKKEEGNTKNPRPKRWVGIAARLFSAGRALFRGSVRAPKPTVSGSRVTQQYTRPGNYNDAVRDFNRFRPDNVRNFNKNGISGQTGTVGNHRVTVRDGSKQGSPTLEIRSPRTNGEHVRKFRYNK